MKIPIIDKTGKQVSEYDIVISEDIREDIFKKAIVSERSLFRQSYGATPLAGKTASINVTKRRQKYKSTYGKGGSRTPKKIMWRRGMQIRFVGAFASGTVGGRRAHPPKAQKVTFKDMNNKEWLKALMVGFSASMNKKIVLENGQKVPQSYPFVFDKSIETINKTKDFKEFLLSLGFDDEISRVSTSKVRAGKGKMRNRKYKNKRGPLVVVSSSEVALFKSSSNVKGFEVIVPELLMTSDFGMSHKPGRAVIFTKPALDEFMEVLK